MKQFVPLIYLAMLCIGCGKGEPQQTPAARPQQEMRTADPAAFVSPGFFDEQARKRDALRHQLDSLRALPLIDRKAVTQLVNRRKGELMSLKKSIRNSTMYNAAQRDSLITPLDEESIELAGDLIAVAK